MNLLEYLKQEPRARERANKNRALGNLITKEYGLEIDKSKMADIVGEVLSLDRKWRKILEENPDLRGSDYDKKETLEQEKMLELGYSPNYHNDVRQLGLLK